MIKFAIPCALGAVALSAFAASAATTLPFDEPTMINGIDTACTGVGEDARSDPRWAQFPLKIVLAGKGGQFLGDADLSVTKSGRNVVSVHCGGPWVLLRLDPGTYRVSANVNGTTASAMATVPSSGQGRIVLRFPEQGGTISKEHVPATS